MNDPLLLVWFCRESSDHNVPMVHLRPAHGELVPLAAWISVTAAGAGSKRARVWHHPSVCEDCMKGMAFLGQEVKDERSFPDIAWDVLTKGRIRD